MTHGNKIFRFIPILFVTAFIALTLIFPGTCSSGVAGGLILCADVIIPALFPFTVCLLFLVNSGIFLKLRFIEPITKKLFNLESEPFSVMLLSLIGGYPVGARLIKELYLNKKISKKNSHIMQYYAVNAGPAFIIAAVGSKVLFSKAAGIVLFVSHITASLVIAVFCRRFISPEISKNNTFETNPLSFADNFVKSTADAATTIISICAYVVFFSALNSFIMIFANKIPFAQILVYFNEVTTCVTSIKNVYIISFMLGFAGICVWCQVSASSSGLGMNFPIFIIARIIHGALSAAITYLLIKGFKIQIPVFSNIAQTECKPFYSTPTISVSIIIMAIILAISLYGKKVYRNLKSDMI